MDKATQNDHDETQIPSLESLLRLKDDTRRLTAVNYDGVIYSVGCFVRTLHSPVPFTVVKCLTHFVFV